jgi:hypothetical protein
VTAVSVPTTADAGAASRSMRRPMRTERLVTLRSTMPVQLVTLRHTVPLRLQGIQLEAPETTTPKVERTLETAAGKGGEAR